MFDFTLAIFQGSAQSASFLQFLPVENASMTFNQFGGVGPAKYTINNLQYQNLTNLVAPNRVDAYRRYDTLTQSAASGQATLHVNTGSRFAVNQSVLVYDGVHSDFKTVSSIAGNVLTLNSNLSGTYAVGATVLGLTHRGRVSTVEANAAMSNTHMLQTTSYFQELANFVPATASSDGRECGWFLYNLLNTYANSFDLNINAANFVKSSDAAGAVSGGGTGIGYMANNTNSPLLNVIQDVLNVANGSSTNTNTGNQGNNVWNFWIDLNNNVHFGQVDLTTATKTYSATTYSQTADGFFDMLTDHVTHDQDTTNLVNTYILLGGQASNAQGATTKVTVFDQNSVNQYGQIEQVITLPNITDENTLKAIGTAKLNASAYPINQYRSTLGRTAVPPTCQDVIKVQDLADSNANIFYSEQFSAQTIELIWDVNRRDFLQTRITGAQLLPNINQVMRQIAAQHYIPTTGVTGGINITDRYVLQGVVGSYASNTLSITPGIIVASVQVSGSPVQSQYNIPTTTFSPTANGTWTVGYLYRNANGTAYATPQIVEWSGIAVPSTAGFTSFQMIPLFTITAMGGVIVSMADLRNLGGLSNSNFQQNPNPSTAPVFASGYTHASVTAGLAEYMPPINGGASGSVSAQFTFGLTTGHPTWLEGLNLYAIPVGTTFSPPAGLKNTIAPTSNGVYSGVIVDGLNPGASVDIYATFLDLSGKESPGLPVATATPAAMVIGSINQAGMPGGTVPNAALSYLYLSAPYTSAPLISTGSGGTTTGTTYNAEIPFFTDGVGSSATFWLFEIQLMMRIHGTTNWQQVGTVAPTSTSNTSDGSGVAEYVGVWTNLGMSNAVDFGIRYLAHNGGISTVTQILSNAVVSLSAAALPTMPAGTTISGALSGSLSYSGVGSAQYACSGSVTITISDANYAKWLKEIHILSKQVPASSTDGDTTASDFYDLYTIPASKYTGSGTPCPFTIPLGASANNYEITLQAIDNQGKVIVATPFTVATAQQVNGSALVPSGVNFVRDSAFTAGLTYWKGVGTPTMTTYPANNAGTGNPAPFAGSPGVNTNCTGALYSAPFTPVPGAWYNMEALVGWGDVGGGGSMHVAICNVSDFNAGNLAPATTYGTVLNVPIGGFLNNTSSPVLWQCPSSGGPSQICYVWWWVNANYPFSMTEPQISGGQSWPGYVVGAVAGSDGRLAPQSLGDPATNPAYGQAPHGAMSAQVTAVVGGTSGAPTLTVNPGGGVVGQLPLTAHDATVQNRNGISFSCTGQPPYVNASNQLVFPSSVRVIRPDGSRTDIPSGFGPVTMPSTSGQVFLHWLAGNTNTDSVVAIARTATGVAGTGYAATVASSNYEPIGAFDTTPSPYAFSFYGPNSNASAAAYDVIPPTSTGVGVYRTDKAHPSYLLPYLNHTSEFRNLIDQTSGRFRLDNLGTNYLGALDYGAHNVAFRNVIDNSSTLDVSKARAATILPYSNHSAPFTASIDSVAGSDGIYLKNGTVGNRHVLDNTVSRRKSQGGVGQYGTGGIRNLLFNPSFYNNGNGWSASISTGSNLVGDGILHRLVMVATNVTSTPVWSQLIPGIPGGYNMVFSAEMEIDALTTGYAYVDVVFYNAAGTVLGTNGYPTQITSSQYLEYAITTPANTDHVVFRMYYSNFTSGANALTAILFRPQLEFGTVATPWSDDGTSAVGTYSFGNSADANGSYFLPSQISAKHLYGGNPGDNGALVDSNSVLLHARHATPIRNAIDSSGNFRYDTAAGVLGFLPYANHDVNFRSVIDNAATLDVSKARSGILLPYANHQTVIKNAIDVSGNLRYDTMAGVTGNLPLTNHNQTIQNRNGIIVNPGATGQAPYVSATGGTLTFPNNLNFIRPDGTSASIAAGSTVTLTVGNQGSVFMLWSSGALVAISRIATGAAGTGYVATATSSLYEFVGSYSGASTQPTFSLVGGISSNLQSAVYDVLQSNNDGTGNFHAGKARTGTVLPLLNHDANVQGVQQRNLLKNGNFQLAGAFATGGGWNPGNGLVSSYGCTTNHGYGAYGSYPSEQFVGTAGGTNTAAVAGAYQTINVKPNTNYSYVGALYLYNNVSGAYATIGASSANWATALITSTPPSGTLPGFYTNIGTDAGNVNTSTYNAWKIVRGTFNSGSNLQVQVYIMGYSPNNTTAVPNFFANGLMVWEGTKYQDYVDGDVLPGSILDSHIGKVTVDTLTDGTYAKVLASRVSTGKPVIDFNDTFHFNKSTDFIQEGGTNKYFNGKTLDSLPDGTSYKRVGANYIYNDPTYGNGAPVINFAATGHVNKTLANMGGTIGYGQQSSEYAANFDSSGNVKKTSAFNTNAPNMIPIQMDFAFVYNFPTATTGSPPANRTMTWYICGRNASTDAPVSGQAVKFTNPDGTTFNAASGANTVNLNGGGAVTSTGTSGSLNIYDTGVVGNAVYALIYYKPSNSTWYVTLQTTAITSAQVATASADGIIALVQSYSSSNLGASGSGGGGSSHGGRPVN